MKLVLIGVASAAIVTFQSTAERTAGGQSTGPGAQAATSRFKPLVANAVPSRTCESLSAVSIPNTTIESAVLDPGEGAASPSCRVTAVTDDATDFSCVGQ